MAAKLKKFVTINAFTSKTNVGVGFNVLRKAINRTGTTPVSYTHLRAHET